MTLTHMIDRLKGSLRKQPSDRPDLFDARLQKLTVTRSRAPKRTQSVFKTRHQRLEA